MEGTPFSTYIWEASSKMSMSNMPISSGRISDTTSGVRSHTRTPLKSSYPYLAMNLFRFHFLLDSMILLMSPRLLDSVMYFRFSWKTSSTLSLDSSLLEVILRSMSAMMLSKSQISCMMSLWAASNLWRWSFRIQS